MFKLFTVCDCIIYKYQPTGSTKAAEIVLLSAYQRVTMHRLCPSVHRTTQKVGDKFWWHFWRGGIITSNCWSDFGASLLYGPHAGTFVGKFTTAAWNVAGSAALAEDCGLRTFPVTIMPPPPHSGGIKRCFCLTSDICLSDVCRVHRA